MQIQRRRKGFTLVELLVVIAIIAILATVSIIGYTQFIKRANMSADQQAVTQMNTLLEGLDVNNEPDDVVDLWAYLNETGLNAEDYKPLTKDHYFFWDQSINRILLVDKENKVVFPKAYSEAGKTNSKVWYTLSGTIELKPAPEVIDGIEVKVANASDFIQTMTDHIADASGEVSTISLTSDVNMMGASHGSVDLAKSLTIDGDLGNGKIATVSNLVSTEYASVGKGADIYLNKKYGSGLFGNIGDGKSQVQVIVVIKNITFDGFVIGDYETGSTGIIAGIIHKNAIVELQNVTFKNCTVYGLNKAGLIAGQIKGKLILNNVKIENSVVNASEGESGRVFGTVMTSGIIDNQGCSIDDNTVLNIVKYGIHEFVNINDVEYVTRVKFDTDVPTTATHTFEGEEDHPYTIVYQKGTSSTIGWFKPTSAYAKVSNSDYCGSGINEIIQVTDIGNINEIFDANPKE
jgi:prepilin-type N-terminal cleavage/methylation domain-containing protein